jgi:hypothetical protein
MQKGTAALSIVAVLSFVTLILSYGIPIPEDLGAFKLLGAAGALAGLPIGEMVAQKIKNQLKRALLIVGALIVCVGSLLYYLIYVQSGSANISDIVLLAIFLTVTFFSFTFLMAMARVSLVARR